MPDRHDEFLDLVADSPKKAGDEMPDVDVSESTMAALRTRSLENHEAQSAMIMGGLNFSSEALRAGMIKTQNETDVPEASALRALLNSPPMTNP
jgi:hypothetical protein